MKLINTTNSHSQLVKKPIRKHRTQLLVEVYSAGNTDVVFTQAPLHYEILIPTNTVLFVNLKSKPSKTSS